MTQETIDKAKALLAAGYNMNQIASMLTVDRVALSTALIEKPVKTTKKVETKIEPMFEEEEGL
jgi:hypothetical protein